MKCFRKWRNTHKKQRFFLGEGLQAKHEEIDRDNRKKLIVAEVFMEHESSLLRVRDPGKKGEAW